MKLMILLPSDTKGLWIVEIILASWYEEKNGATRISCSFVGCESIGILVWRTYCRDHNR